MKKNLISFSIIIIFLIAIFYSPLEGWLACETGWMICPPPSPTQVGEYSSRGEFKSVQIAGQNVKVDLALTEAEQAQGLSGRQSLAPNTGMLFVFAEPGKYLFWMKDMNFPIDMIWLAPQGGGADSKAKVIYIKKNASPKLYPETYGPSVDAKYVLEVPAGFSDENNLQVGDGAEFKF
jgi:hypothetical protein